MYTTETVYTSKATERLVVIFDSTYTKAKIEQVSTKATHMNAEEKKNY